VTARQRQIWSWSAIAFVVVAGILGAIAERLTNRIADHVESRFGYTPDPEGTREFLATLQHPTFGDAAPDSLAEARGVDTFLHRHVDKAHREVYGLPWKSWDQGNHGACVSFAFALGSYTGQAVDWTQGRMARPPPEVATEPIYAGSRTAARLPPIQRNTGGDGSYGGAAARWISAKCKDPTVGGILYREKYGNFDLSKYSISRSIEWGREGVPLALAREATKHKAVAVAQVTTWDELCASIERGSPVVLCSNVGYGEWDNTMPVRDADGFLQRKKPWGHAMLCWGVRHKKNGSPRDGGLIQNSWAETWCKGPKWPADQPDGSFWAARQDIEAALAQGDSFAIGGVDGFAWREIDNGQWFEPAPPEPIKPGEVATRFNVDHVVPRGTFSLAP
jgi:hypothetical protein